MRAVGYGHCSPVDDKSVFEGVKLDEPTPGPRDLLVDVRAVSVNPVDTKLRAGAEPVDGFRVLGFDAAGVVLDTGSAQHFPAVVDLIRPRGAIAIIDDPKGIDVALIKTKSLSLHLEFMFTRAMFQTEDMIVQRDLLSRVADLVDEGAIKSTVDRYGGRINAENLLAAHAMQERGDSIGKTVLGGF